ncbi:hypothetical protein Pla110_29260 [Polystyrenella longa]|uniref:Uncharacterized protein n=1 Tax=Polystyrenella longa TaxID=2528007 RepID=A0A518CPM7_9PLAN|nr:hypothetical protein Pla110_29260 [Polystyrenella longa]
MLNVAASIVANSPENAGRQRLIDPLICRVSSSAEFFYGTGFFPSPPNLLFNYYLFSKMIEPDLFLSWRRKNRWILRE